MGLGLLVGASKDAGVGVGLDVGAAVDVAVGAAVGGAVGLLLGESTGAAVGVAVGGAEVGFTGARVGFTGDGVGFAGVGDLEVGIDDGDFMREKVILSRITFTCAGVRCHASNTLPALACSLVTVNVPVILFQSPVSVAQLLMVPIV